MTYVDIIFAIVVNLSVGAVSKMDWTGDYTCPSYCGTDHKHFVLDLPSSLQSEIEEKRKSIFNKHLERKKNY